MKFLICSGKGPISAFLGIKYTESNILEDINTGQPITAAEDLWSNGQPSGYGCVVIHSLNAEWKIHRCDDTSLPVICSYAL